ncbi:MAG: hypothetical protein AB7F86_09425 [Bdellovibrionales bacterium]
MERILALLCFAIFSFNGFAQTQRHLITVTDAAGPGIPVKLERALAELLQDRLVKKGSYQLTADLDATQDNGTAPSWEAFRQSLASLGQSQSESVVLGVTLHGRVEDERFYLTFSDGAVDGLEFLAALSRIKTKKLIVLMESCYSGGLIRYSLPEFQRFDKFASPYMIVTPVDAEHYQVAGELPRMLGQIANWKIFDRDGSDSVDFDNLESALLAAQPYTVSFAGGVRPRYFKGDKPYSLDLQIARSSRAGGTLQALAAESELVRHWIRQVQQSDSKGPSRLQSMQLATEALAGRSLVATKIQAFRSLIENQKSLVGPERSRFAHFLFGLAKRGDWNFAESTGETVRARIGFGHGHDTHVVDLAARTVSAFLVSEESMKGQLIAYSRMEGPISAAMIPALAKQEGVDRLILARRFLTSGPDSLARKFGLTPFIASAMNELVGLLELPPVRLAYSTEWGLLATMALEQYPTDLDLMLVTALSVLPVEKKHQLFERFRIERYKNKKNLSNLTLHEPEKLEWLRMLFGKSVDLTLCERLLIATNEP